MWVSISVINFRIRIWYIVHGEPIWILINTYYCTVEFIRWKTELILEGSFWISKFIRRTMKLIPMNLSPYCFLNLIFNIFSRNWKYLSRNFLLNKQKKTTEEVISKCLQYIKYNVTMNMVVVAVQYKKIIIKNISTLQYKNIGLQELFMERKH